MNQFCVFCSRVIDLGKERSIEYFIDESYDVEESKAVVEHGLLTVEIGKKKAFRPKS